MQPIETSNGEITITIGGKPYTFKFGMLAAKFTEQHGQHITGNIETIALTLWAGLMARFEKNGLTDKFSTDDVLNLMDEMSDEDLANVLVVSRYAFERIPNFAARVNGLLEEKQSPPTGKPSK